jgi:hypothetical protein
MRGSTLAPASPDAAESKHYTGLKHALALQHANDRGGYTAAEAKLFVELLGG